MYIDLSGTWSVTLQDGSTWNATLPGTLDENQIGHKDTPHLASRLTRRYSYEGAAIYTRFLHAPMEPDSRIFLEIERSRCLTLQVNGIAITPYHPGTLSTPWIFEVTKAWKADNEIMITCDNSYPGLPYTSILNSSAATDETQTNWNGLLGYIRLRTEPCTFIDQIRVYPHGEFLDVDIDIDSVSPDTLPLTLASSALPESINRSTEITAGRSTLHCANLPLSQTALRWDEYEGHLYTLTASLGPLQQQTLFGIRDFSSNSQGRFTLNHRVLFLRSEANCCEFPETGHAPMTVSEWKDVLKTYASYGINCMRFHSHCPPEAAFTAADELGILMQPELSHWNPQNAFEDTASQIYYKKELLEILRTYANHPSFVMLTFGNELHALENGYAYMHELLHLARQTDPTRLYANGSNAYYGQRGADPASDFYTSQKYYEQDLRGTFSGMKGYINHSYPSADHNYNDSIRQLRTTYQGPVFSFEVGQFEILPDFDEIPDFQGVTLPVNLEIIRQNVDQRGLLPRWKDYVEATGELSRIGYREEIEAALRTPGLSGISLLGLQDFTGQGTALVGMLNSHLQPKPYSFANPAAFRHFFGPVVPLVLLPRYTYTVGETLMAPTQLANYGKQNIVDAVSYRLGAVSGTLSIADCPMGALTDTGILEIPLEHPGRQNLTIRINGHENTYPIWVYPDEALLEPQDILITGTLDETALATLMQGGKVFVTPPATQEALPHSIQNQFTTDFWSVGTFSYQDGGMGLLIDRQHPALADFPTESHSNWQWWVMSKGRAVVVPDTLRSIVTVMDCYNRLRSLSCLFECRVGPGRLLFSSMGLMEHTQYPEVRALLNSLLRYMDSPEFTPQQELTIPQLRSFFE